MESQVFKTYNEMGDGYDEVAIIYDYGNMKMKIMHVGRFADENMVSSTYVRRDENES